MNSIEETLWNYIDGNCTVAGQKAISNLIATDEAYRTKYEELLSFNHEMAAMEIDEPSMAFSYKVMEAIRTENAQVPLKAAINKRIILSITVFFVLTISLLVIYVFASVNWSLGNISVDIKTPDFKLPASVNVTEVKSTLKGPLLQGFMFFDLILGLFLADFYLRKRNVSKTV